MWAITSQAPLASEYALVQAPCRSPLDERGGRCRGTGVLPRLVVDRGGSAAIQQGQVFKLKARSGEGEPLWAHRYRVSGRGSARRQVGGFRSSAEAQRA